MYTTVCHVLKGLIQYWPTKMATHGLKWVCHVATLLCKKTTLFHILTCMIPAPSLPTSTTMGFSAVPPHEKTAGKEEEEANRGRRMRRMRKSFFILMLSLSIRHPVWKKRERERERVIDFLG